MGKYCPLCRKSGNVNIYINDAAIQREFAPGGQVHKHIKVLAALHVAGAREHAPNKAKPRTGRLKRRHYWRYAGTGTLNTGYYVGTTADYARFLKGTKGQGSGYIYPKRGTELVVRPVPYSYFRIHEAARYRERVKGQKEHRDIDWLLKGAKEAFREYRLLLFPKPNGGAAGWQRRAAANRAARGG